MAAGDAYVVAPTSVADDASLDFVPASGEIALHNVYVPRGEEVELYWTDGGDSILIDSGTESYNDFHWHCTTTAYISVKNVSGGSIFLGGDGIHTENA